MTQEEIIEMPPYLNASYEGDDLYTGDQVRELMKLVAEKERERYMQLFLDPENQPTQFGTATQEYREQEIKQEREKCAKIADEIDPVWESISDAIRARGQA